MTNTTTRPTEWEARQYCGECGDGFFRLVPVYGVPAELGPICTECGHEHPLDRWNLSDDEEFTYRDGILYVVAYAVSA